MLIFYFQDDVDKEALLVPPGTSNVANSSHRTPSTQRSVRGAPNSAPQPQPPKKPSNPARILFNESGEESDDDKSGESDGDADFTMVDADVEGKEKETDDEDEGENDNDGEEDASKACCSHCLDLQQACK